MAGGYQNAALEVSQVCWEEAERITSLTVAQALVRRRNKEVEIAELDYNIGVANMQFGQMREPLRNSSNPNGLFDGLFPELEQWHAVLLTLIEDRSRAVDCLIDIGRIINGDDRAYPGHLRGRQSDLESEVATLGEALNELRNMGVSSDLDPPPPYTAQPTSRSTMVFAGVVSGAIARQPASRNREHSGRSAARIATSLEQAQSLSSSRRSSAVDQHRHHRHHRLSRREQLVLSIMLWTVT